MRREGELPSGSPIGRYVVLYRLGRGGMGVVYAAYDPQLDRKVAVKLLRKRNHALASNESHGRMLREAQALARLSHPNVVAVHDAGLLDGQVFVAMDFVDGETLRRWLKGKPRSRREIVSAFVQAGDALMAAHAADIVHRDFKPDNAIIGRDGRVQVLDFGLARLQSDTPADRGPALSVRSGPDTQRGTEGRRQGTPAYMAPEQHDRERVGPAADQFSFCVSLWEALCERPPFSGKDDALVEAIKAGQLHEPPRGKLSGHLRKILRRGLSADPQQRYPSMRALLVDLRRDPRRHWRRMSLGVAAVALSGGGAVVYAQVAAQPSPCSAADERLEPAWSEQIRADVGASIGGASRGHAEHTRDAVTRALDDYAERWSTAYVDSCEATHLRHEQSESLLDLRMACLGGHLESLSAVTELLVDADADVVDHALATVDGLPEVSRCANVIALRERQALPRDPERRKDVEAARARVAQSRALEHAGRVEAALVSARSVLRRAKELEYQPLMAEAGLALGTALDTLGESAEARTALLDAEVAAEIARDDALLARIRVRLVTVEGQRQGSAAAGLTWAQLSRATLQRLGGDPETEAMLEANIATAIEHEAPPEEVLAHQRRALELAESAGLSELRLASFYNDLAGTLAQTGEFDEALQRAQQARLTWAKTLGNEHHRVAAAMYTLGYIHDMREDNAQALEWYQRGYAQMADELGPNSPRTASILSNLAITHARLGHNEEAERDFRRVLTLRQESLGPDHVEVARAHGNLGVILARRGQKADALTQQRRALAIKQQVLGPDNPQVASSLEEVANALQGLERHSEALLLRERALAIREESVGPEHPLLSTSLANISHNRLDIGDLDIDRALTDARRALLLSDDPSVSAETRAFVRLVLAKVLSRREQDLVRARELFDRAQEALVDKEAPSSRKIVDELAERHGWAVVLGPQPSTANGTP